MAKNLIIIGPPGSGKGTQAKVIAQKFRLFYFGTGDLMRQEAQSGTKLGQKFQAVWGRGEGELVSDEIVDEFVFRKFEEINQAQGIVFDGYPRTIRQAENLDIILFGGIESCMVVNIEVPSELLIQRMSTRRVCQKCGKVFFEAQKQGIEKCDKCGGQLSQREEDTQEVMRKRILVYEEQTQPLIDYFRDHGILVDINGRPNIREVTKAIVAKIKGQLER